MKNIIADTIFELSDLLYKLHTQINSAKPDNREIERIKELLKKNFNELFLVLNENK